MKFKKNGDNYQLSTLTNTKLEKTRLLRYSLNS